MKKFFLMAGIIVSGFVAAQQPGYPGLPKAFKRPLTGKPVLPRYDALRSFPPAASSLPPAKKLLYTLPNGNQVYTLSQDHMPCIVPDMRRFTMPNAGKQAPLYRYPAPGAIPNPVSQDYRSIAYTK